MTSPSKEDYVEAIWNLIQEKGYVRTIELAERLGVNSASVSKMIQRLDDDGLVVYERYRGTTLTEKGTQLGVELFTRHTILESFFKHLGLTQQLEVHSMVEGIEHYINENALKRMNQLVNFIVQNPHWWNQFLLQRETG